jgi:hypothetical protein
MEKPTARGPSPHRKAEQALRSKLNRKDKPPPLLPENGCKNRQRGPVARADIN